MLAGPAYSEETQRTFIGASKCKTCHKTEAQGQQYVLWEKAAHSKAYETLAGESAKAIAKERGIEDPQTAAECLKCHVTAYGVDKKFLGEKYAITDGVGCESCHGAGGDYSKMKTMKAITSGETEPASVGLVIPNEKTCVGCHNEESPTFKEFDFEKMVAKIAHPIPEERKAKYKAAE
ncbi:MAG: cytochrome C554 [Candidatus Latescibacterota bacterium]|nr:MAG: cytochrome C554 [Candidatus Latescibacterota bacterium]